MDVELIQVDRAEASRQYRLYSQQAQRTGAPSYIKELRRAYWHLRRGKQVIDVLAAFQKVGVNAEGDPRLAIAHAEHKTVRYRKESGGAIEFESSPLVAKEDSWSSYRKVMSCPNGTYPEWSSSSGAPHWGIIRRQGAAPVPIIPAAIMARCRRPDPTGLFILWEVDHWTPIPPRDPILLTRLSKYLFAVIGQWDLTPLEQSIIRART